MNNESLGVVAVRAARRRGWTCEQLRAMLERLEEGWPYYNLDAPPIPGSGWATTAWLNPNIWQHWDKATDAPFAGGQNFRVDRREKATPA